MREVRVKSVWKWKLKRMEMYTPNPSVSEFRLESHSKYVSRHRAVAQMLGVKFALIWAKRDLLQAQVRRVYPICSARGLTDFCYLVLRERMRPLKEKLKKMWRLQQHCRQLKITPAKEALQRSCVVS